MNLINDMKTILEMKGISDKTKLQAIIELTNGFSRELPIKEEFVAKNKKYAVKKKYNAFKKLTQTEIDTVAREYFINGNSPTRIAKLIGRTKLSVGNIVSRLRTGKKHASFTVNMGRRK